MDRLFLFTLLLPSLAAWPSGPQDPKQASNTVALNGHHFTLPPGFTIELVAGPPLVDRPVAINFDEQGRLYVTEMAGAISREDVAKQKKLHRVLCLESTKGDGRFDKKTVFADQIAFPEGVLYYKGSVYVAAPPSIWKLTDTTGKGVADQRVEWFQGQTITGCANDLHGPYLGPDGWIYWCKGAFAQQTYLMPGRPGYPGFSWTTRAAHIFRAAPNDLGRTVECVMTGGMDNPVGLVFTPGGERIFTTTFLQYPGGGKRDGLIHAVYGGIYGKEFHDVIDSHTWTGPSVLPPMTHLGAAAPCGLRCYESDALGKEYKGNLFTCCFNMRKVTRHVLIPDGATFKTIDSDFLVSDNADFHPTDVMEDADGSLLVVDTGGWYKLCCPTSQLVRPEALGGIYRISKKGMKKIVDPRGLKLNWQGMSPENLGKLLGDPRPFVCKRAVEALANTKNDMAVLVEVLEDDNLPASARCNAVWTLTRMNGKKYRAAVRKALEDSDETVRQAAIHAAGLWRDVDAVNELRVILRGKSLHNRRAAAEALGRIGDASEPAIPDLLAALGEPCDRMLEHSLIYALIEIGAFFADTTAAGMKSKNAAVRRGTMIALDQMDRFKAEQVAKELASSDPRMKEAAWWIAGRHPDWGGTVAGFLRDHLAAKELTAAEQGDLVKQLAKFARGSPVQQLLTERLGEAKASKLSKRLALHAMAQSGLKQVPDEWNAALAALLVAADHDLVQEAINTARIWRDGKQSSAKLAAALVQVGDNAKAPVGVRLTAFAAVPGGLKKVQPAQFALFCAHLGIDQPVLLRGAAADVLGRAKLTSEQLRSLAVALKKIGPMELDRVLEAYTGCSDDAVGKELLAALQTADAKTSLRIETLKPRLSKFGPAVQKEAAVLYAALNVDGAKQQAHLEKLLAELKDGDVSRGRTVFNSQKAACFTCHAIGYLGGTVGPDLTRIAKIRTERDLLESIVFPSATFVRSYEPVVVVTKAGQVLNGVIRKDGAAEIVLATGINQEVRIAREDIDEMRPSQVSVMPAGYDQLLTRQELADLMAFLKACK
jgi:putative membrane-bound dehydrogenase-like protein